MTDATDRQLEVLRFIARYIADNGYPPATRDIQDAFDLSSTNSVHEHLAALMRKGLLERIPMRARTLRLTKQGLVELGRVA